MKDCAKKISRTQTFSKLWVVRKVWHFIKREKKYMKYWQIGQIVYSHFLIENWKVKTFGTITAYINIEKLNERGKKRLNAKLERHLTRSHILLCEVFAYIYIYIYIWINMTLPLVFKTGLWHSMVKTTDTQILLV